MCISSNPSSHRCLDLAACRTLHLGVGRGYYQAPWCFRNYCRLLVLAPDFLSGQRKLPRLIIFLAIFLIPTYSHK